MDQGPESIISDVDLPKWIRCKFLCVGVGSGEGSGRDESEMETFGRDDKDNSKAMALLSCGAVASL